MPFAVGMKEERFTVSGPLIHLQSTCAEPSPPPLFPDAMVAWLTFVGKQRRRDPLIGSAR